MAFLTDYFKPKYRKPQPGTLAEFLARPKIQEVALKPKPLSVTHYTPIPGVVGPGIPRTGEVPLKTEPVKRAEEISAQLGGEAAGRGLYALEEPKAPVGAGVDEFQKEEIAEPGKPTDIYNYSKIQTDLATAGTEKKSAYDEMLGLQVSLYEDEYGKVGLGDTKTKIAGIDTDITNRKSLRDKMLLDEMGKPIPQWMIKGRKKEEVDAATADLNRLIDQRNTLASQYNTGIDEVTRKVGYGMKDAGTKYTYWESEEKRLSGLVKSYQTALIKELSEEEKTERWEKGFGLDERLMALREAEAKKPEPEKTVGWSEWAAKYGLIGMPESEAQKVLSDIFEKEKAEEKTPEEIADEMIKEYFDYGKTRKDIENMYKEAEKPIPLEVEMALDKFYGKKKKGFLSEIWHRLPGIK